MKNFSFFDVPLGDHTLRTMCEKLNIPIKGIFSRDQKMEKNHSPCIINMDDSVGNGTHWVACFDRGNVLEYFDSFAVPPPEEWLDNLREKGFVRNTKQIQEWESARCGWYCLYFLNERTKGVDYEKLLNVFGEDLEKNERFVEKYFTDL